MKTISQREARRLRKEVDRLLAERVRQQNAYYADYPGGTNIATLTVQTDSNIGGRLDAARQLDLVLVAKVTPNYDGKTVIRLFAVQP